MKTFFRKVVCWIGAQMLWRQFPEVAISLLYRTKQTRALRVLASRMMEWSMCHQLHEQTSRLCACAMAASRMGSRRMSGFPLDFEEDLRAMAHAFPNAFPRILDDTDAGLIFFGHDQYRMELDYQGILKNWLESAFVSWDTICVLAAHLEITLTEEMCRKRVAYLLYAGPVQNLRRAWYLREATIAANHIHDVPLMTTCLCVGIEQDLIAEVMELGVECNVPLPKADLLQAAKRLLEDKWDPILASVAAEAAGRPFTEEQLLTQALRCAKIGDQDAESRRTALQLLQLILGLRDRQRVSTEV